MLYSGPPGGLRDVAAVANAPASFRDRAADRAHDAASPEGWLRLTGVTRNNLHDLDVAFPLGVFTTVTGVSGSGKSSLVSQALVELVAEQLGHELPADEERGRRARACRRRLPRGGRIAGGMEHITRLVRVDQKPIGRTPRSNLATYTGLFDHVRKLFAATKAARARHYDAGRFSFNVAKGPLRDLRRRRFRHGRAAVPAERLCAVSDLPRRALQREDAGDQVSRQEHRRSAGHDGRRRV